MRKGLTILFQFIDLSSELRVVFISGYGMARAERESLDETDKEENAVGLEIRCIEFGEEQKEDDTVGAKPVEKIVDHDPGVVAHALGVSLLWVSVMLINGWRFRMFSAAKSFGQEIHVVILEGVCFVKRLVVILDGHGELQ